MRYSRLLMLALFFGLGLNLGYSSPNAAADKTKTKKSKEADPAKYYKKWLDEDVLYIISEEEKKVFKDLKTDEERDSFIDEFWARRNPDPRSGGNSFKEEHYRRIAYANERFASGVPGWKTDRGRIYIMYGKPDETESHPTGGAYERPVNEGGGSTTTFPFEKWWYRHIDGVGDDIEIEFVDNTMTGEYHIAMSPDEKDALLNVQGAGLTMAEELGLAQKSDREYFNPNASNNPQNMENMGRTAKDTPFARMERYFALQRPPEIKFNDLKSMVTTHITYNTLPYDVRTDYIRLSSDKVLVPISIELDNNELEFKKELDINRATVHVYGIVTSLTNRIMAEWEDEITSDFTDQYFKEGKTRHSGYQHIVALNPGMRYKLDLVLKDTNSKNVGDISMGLNVPKYEDGVLQSSSIILAKSLTSAPSSSDQLEQYVIGDMKVVPNVKAEYVPGQNLIPYMQIYNMQIDQTSQKPSLEVTFALKTNGKVVEEMKSTSLNSEQFYYGPRVVLLGKIPLKGFSPGKYTLEIRVLDNISNRTLSTSTDFRINQPTTITSIKP